MLAEYRERMMVAVVAGSVTGWIGDLKGGDPAAAGLLWRRYFASLVRLARTRLRVQRGGAGAADEEDAALSAFDSLCAGAAAGRFPRLCDRQDLWRLLVVITVRKALDQLRSERRLRRGGRRRVLDETALAGPGAEGVTALEQCIGREPSPEFALMMAEESQRRLDALGDETLRRIALARIEGYSTSEIAGQLGCVSRTVERKLELIRRVWIREEP